MGCKDDEQPKQVWETPLSAEEKKKIEKMLDTRAIEEKSSPREWKAF